MAYLSVPSPGKWISDLFGKIFFDDFSTIFWDQHFSKKMDLRKVLWPKCQVKKVSDIDALVMNEVFTQIRVFDWNFPSFFSFFVKSYFLFYNIENWF